jgi:OOP family OmpA-OmpF porin
LSLQPIPFGFRSAKLSREAKARLDGEDLPKIAAAQAGRYLVRGHADRIGSPERNRRISERRAQAVRAYLVAKGVPPESIQLVPLGNSVSQTSCTQPSRRALIACLAPDRRVNVEILPPR